MKVQPIYNNKIFKKGLEFAADNGALFVATASLALSTVARPIAIMSTPKTDKENKKYAAAKSLASSAVGYGIMLCASLPLVKAVKQIDENPSKFLKSETIKNLKYGEKSLSKSPKYNFATQLFKLGLGFLIAVPKSILTCALIPPLMKNIFGKKSANNEHQQYGIATVAALPRNDGAAFSFTGNRLPKYLGKIIDTKPVQILAEKFHKTNFQQHIISLTDALATGTFITQVSKSKKIEPDRKKALMYNAGISTGLCIGGGYAINSLTRKSTDKFIENFKSANKNSPKLEKYVEGIKIAKPALILGGLYYIVIPLISTFLADRFDKK